jgi:hypothetical protein
MEVICAHDAYVLVVWFYDLAGRNSEWVWGGCFDAWVIHLDSFDACGHAYAVHLYTYS